MTTRAATTVLAAIALVAAASACTNTDDGSQLRHATAAATLGDGSVRGEFIVNGSTVMVLDMLSDDKQLTGYDIDSGTETWSVSTGSFGHVWLGDDFFALQPDKRHVEIRDLDTGELRHEIDLEPENDAGTEASLAGTSNDTVFVINPKGDRQEVLSALDAKSGDELWTYEPDDDGSFTAIRPVGVEFGNTSGMALGLADALRRGSGAPVVTVVESGSPGEITALDVDSGEFRWSMGVGKGEVPWPDWSGETSDLVSVVTDLDESTSARMVTAVHAESSDSVQIDAGNDVYDAGDHHWRAPTGDEGGVLVTEGFVFAQDDEHHPQVSNLRTGDTTWTAKHEGRPLAYGDGIAVYRQVTKDGAGKVYGVDSGEVLWKSASIDAKSNTVIVDGHLVVSGKDGTEVYDVKTGEGLWRFRGTLLGWNDDYYLFKSTENDKSVEVVKRDGRLANSGT